VPDRISPAATAASSRWNEAVKEVGVQGLKSGSVGPQRRSKAMLGNQKVNEEVDPPRQSSIR
jgi:hypothetical protein